MRLPGRLGQLTYCTNIHRGESWAEIWNVLRTDLLAVKTIVAPRESFGVGLRLSGLAVAAASEPAVIAELKAFLAANDLYVFTLNAFPYGPFHGVPVKENVYLPDWQDEARLTYTNDAASLLAALLPADQAYGSVSTVPGAFKARIAGPDAVASMTDLMLRHVAHLVDLERRTRRVICLALEPEPCCFLETTDEAIAFFETYLFSNAAADRLAGLANLSRDQAADAVRRHLGLCVDLCHAAVEFETPGDVFSRLRASGIAIAKVQISAGLKLTHVGSDTRDLLRPFDEGTYLHQVVERGAGGDLRRHVDLCHAMALLDHPQSPSDAPEWRVHFHVPLFLDNLGPFGSTQDFVREALAMHRIEPLSAHLEVETYTWDVLPERYRGGGVVPAIARELQWVRRQLGL